MNTQYLTVTLTWLFDRCTDQFEISRFLAEAEVHFWCTHAWDKNKRDGLRYRYFVDFRHGISVFANFSYGIAVLRTPPPPQCPPQLLKKSETLKTLDVQISPKLNEVEDLRDIVEAEEIQEEIVETIGKLSVIYRLWNYHFFNPSQQ